MRLLERRGVNLRLRRSQGLEDRNGRLFGCIASRGVADDLANLIQSARVLVLVWCGYLCQQMLVSGRMFVVLMVTVLVLVLFSPVFLPWKVLFAVHPNVHLGCGDAAANDA